MLEVRVIGKEKMERKIAILFAVSLIALILSLFAVILVLNSGSSQMANPNPKTSLRILSFTVVQTVNNQTKTTGGYLSYLSLSLPSKYENSCLFNCELVVSWLTTSGSWNSSSEELGFLYPAIASYPSTPYIITVFPSSGMLNFNASTLHLPKTGYNAPWIDYSKLFNSVQNVTQCLNIDAYGYAKP
jgi:hypothetical protein